MSRSSLTSSYGAIKKLIPSPRRSAPESPRGTAIADYDIVRAIGLDSTGADVFTVRRRTDSETLVLKRDWSDGHVMRVAKRMSLWRTMQHEGILQIVEDSTHDVPCSGSMRSATCVVLEYCEHGDLHARCKMLGPCTRIPEAWLVKWVMQMLEALRYLHSRNIMHRAVKPQNIFLSSDFNVKLGGCELSCTTDSSSAYDDLPYSPHTAPEMYLAPHEREGRVGCGVDIWALGSVIADMMGPSLSIDQLLELGEPGFCLTKSGDAPPDEARLRIIEGEMHNTLKRLWPKDSYSSGLLQFVLQMLCAAPSQRPTAAELLEMDFIKEWKAKLAESPLEVGTLEALLLSRAFKWDGRIWVTIKQGDVMEQDVDVIVVPQGAAFNCEGGLAGAIARKDPSIRSDLAQAKRDAFPEGTVGMAEPVFMEGAVEGIRAESMIHVVGPDMHTRDPEEWLEATFLECLKVANMFEKPRICFPAIGTGGAGLTPQQCARSFFNVLSNRKHVRDFKQIAHIVLLCNEMHVLRGFSEEYRERVTSL